jgi:hypothetical protein
MYSLDAPIERKEDHEPISTTYLELLCASEDSDPAKRFEKDELTDLLAGLDEQTIERMNDETLEHYRDKLREAGYAGRGVPASERERLKVIEPQKGISGRPERLALPADDVEGDLPLRQPGSKKDRTQRQQHRKAVGDQNPKKLSRNMRGLGHVSHGEARMRAGRRRTIGKGYPLGKSGRPPRHLRRRQQRELDHIWAVMEGRMMTAEEFERQYAERSGVEIDWLREYRTVRPCDCGEPLCEGWQMVSHEAAEEIDDAAKPWAR